MKKEGITVREFEPIKKDISLGGIGEKNFTELKKFVTEYDTYTEKSSAGSDSTDVFRICFDRINGEYVKAKNYVGIIQLKNGFRVQILPKLDLSASEEDEKRSGFKETKRVFLKMLKTLGYFSPKVFQTADIETSDSDIYEIFIAMYISSVERLVKQGLKSDYSGIEENANFLKGKMLFNKQVNANFVHKEKFYITYDLFSENRPENRLIKTALYKLLRISVSDRNKRDIKRLFPFFENIGLSLDIDNDFSSVKKDRGMTSYEDILVWTKVFLKNESFTAFEGSTGALALLFPMEKLFESYVAEKVKKAFAMRGYNVTAQESKYRLLAEVSDGSERGMFSLRPDIVVRRSGEESSQEETVIMDTKWKRLEPDRYKNYGISQADMYQMYAYCKEYKKENPSTRSVYVLYPYSREFLSTISSPPEFKNFGIPQKNDGKRDTELEIKTFFIKLYDDDFAYELLQKIESEKING